MDRPAVLLQRGLWLEYLTLGWNVISVAVVLAAAASAGSVALAGFGLDSLVEIGASTVVIWQLRDATDRTRERIALRLIGGAFFALALYVLVQSSRSLLLHAHAKSSMLGLGWLALTIMVMLAMAAGKARTGAALGNKVLETEAHITRVDACLAGCVFTGVALNAAYGWWWADPVASLIIVFYGVKEGLHSWMEAKPNTR